eukprot:5551232-Prymnesium_polylepis.1
MVFDGTRWYSTVLDGTRWYSMSTCPLLVSENWSELCALIGHRSAVRRPPVDVRRGRPELLRGRPAPPSGSLLYAHQTALNRLLRRPSVRLGSFAIYRARA